MRKMRREKLKMILNLVTRDSSRLLRETRKALETLQKQKMAPSWREPREKERSRELAA
jgi:hypothetical protein